MKVVLESHEWDHWYEGLSVADTLVWNQHCDQMPYYYRYAASNGKVLEGGCGLGRLVIHLSQMGCDVVGVDSAPGAIAKAKEYDPRLPIQVGDVLSLEFPDSHFGAYISVGVVEHFPEGPWQVLTEARRVLKPGGYLLIDVPVHNLLMRLLEVFPWLDLRHWLAERAWLRSLFNRPRRVPAAQFSNYLYTRDEFTSILRQVGFEIIHSVPVQHTYGLLWSLTPGLARLVTDKRSEWFNLRANFMGRILLSLRRVWPWLFPQSVFVVARKPLLEGRVH